MNRNRENLDMCEMFGRRWLSIVLLITVLLQTYAIINFLGPLRMECAAIRLEHVTENSIVSTIASNTNRMLHAQITLSEDVRTIGQSMEQIDVCKMGKAGGFDFNAATRETQIDLFRRFALQQPPGSQVPRTLREPNRIYYSQIGQDKVIDRLLGGMRNGFFIEAGAYDGEAFSNSLFFEVSRNWTGLLIEPNPRAYRDLLAKDRHAFTTPACIALDNRMSTVSFLAHGMVGGVIERGSRFERMAVDDAKKSPYVYPVDVTCFPLDVMLEAIGVQGVDLFSLDVEGGEVVILEALPFDRIDVRLFVVEENGHGAAIAAIMTRNGYVRVELGAADSYWMRK